MNHSSTKGCRSRFSRLALFLGAVLAITAVAGCATDPGSRSNYSDSHAGHSH